MLHVRNILRQYGADVDVRSLRGVMQFNNGAPVLADATNTVLQCVSPNQPSLVLADKVDTTRLRKADVAVQDETKARKKQRPLVKMQAVAKKYEEEGHLYDPGAW